MAAVTKYDDTLAAMCQQHGTEMEFLNTIFGFLQRRTQFFNGPKVRMLMLRTWWKRGNVRSMTLSRGMFWQAETNFQTLINTLEFQLKEYRKASSKKIDDDDEELEAKKKEEAKALAEKEKVRVLPLFASSREDEH